MNATDFSYCGIDFTDCPLMIATLENDPEQLEMTARWVRQEWNVSDATWENIRCEGCKGEGVRADVCVRCTIRACAQAKGLDNCAECEKYLHCSKLVSIQKSAPEAKIRLDTIYARLNEN